MAETANRASISIATEAADWYARLRAEDVSELDAARFRAWLAGDPARRREFEAIDTFWDDLAAIEKSPEVRRTHEEICARRHRRPRSRASGAIAATLVLAIAAAAFVWQRYGANRYVTDIGEQRTVPLADGSVVTLNTATEIRLHYSQSRRGVELMRGQVNFEVAKDPRRPFIVMAGGGEVRAVGTVFDVYKAANRVTVTLIEGKVAVTPVRASRVDDIRPSSLQATAEKLEAPAAATGDAGVSEIMLAAGEQLSYATEASSIRRVTADLTRVTAWRARKLDFSDTPLLEAIAEANRYSRDQIVLDAPRLQTVRISGTFEAGKNDLFVEGLQSYFPLNARRTADNQIILTDALNANR